MEVAIEGNISMPDTAPLMNEIPSPAQPSEESSEITEQIPTTGEVVLEEEIEEELIIEDFTIDGICGVY